MIQVEKDGWRLEGPLTLATATSALVEGDAAWPPAGWTIDLGGLTQVDSAALSVLLTWQRRAERDSQSLHISSMPPTLRSLAGLYGVEALVAPTAETN
jgi:phospholipid transport system transporter-binding protein